MERKRENVRAGEGGCDFFCSTYSMGKCCWFMLLVYEVYTIYTNHTDWCVSRCHFFQECPWFILFIYLFIFYIAQLKWLQKGIAAWGTTPALRQESVCCLAFAWKKSFLASPPLGVGVTCLAETAPEGCQSSTEVLALCWDCPTRYWCLPAAPDSPPWEAKSYFSH